MPITLFRVLTPNLEHVEGNLGTSNLVSDAMEEVPEYGQIIDFRLTNSNRHFVQPYFDLLPNSASLYLYHAARNWIVNSRNIH